MSSVGVTGNVLVSGLNADLQAGAAVIEHVVQMSRKAVVGARFDGDPNALDRTVFANSNRLLDAVGHGAAERIVKAADEVVPVVLWQRHEGTAHHDEFHLEEFTTTSFRWGVEWREYLVDAVAELLKL